MGAPRKHSREDQAPTEAAPARVGPPPHAGILALQRSAGNRAVAGWLAREPVAEGAVPTGGGSKERAPSTLTLDKLGPLTIESVQVTPPRDSGRGAEGEKPQGTWAVTLVLPYDQKGAEELLRAVMEGRHFKKGEIRMSPMTLTLTNVYVSSANVGGAGGERPLLSITLDAETVETGTATK